MLIWLYCGIIEKEIDKKINNNEINNDDKVDNDITIVCGAMSALGFTSIAYKMSEPICDNINGKKLTKQYIGIKQYDIDDNTKKEIHKRTSFLYNKITVKIDNTSDHIDELSLWEKIMLNSDVIKPMIVKFTEIDTILKPYEKKGFLDKFTIEGDPTLYTMVQLVIKLLNMKTKRKLSEDIENLIELIKSALSEIKCDQEICKNLTETKNKISNKNKTV